MVKSQANGKKPRREIIAWTVEECAWGAATPGQGCRKDGGRSGCSSVERSRSDQQCEETKRRRQKRCHLGGFDFPEIKLRTNAPKNGTAPLFLDLITTRSLLYPPGAQHNQHRREQRTPSYVALCRGGASQAEDGNGDPRKGHNVPPCRPGATASSYFGLMLQHPVAWGTLAE